MTVTGGSSLPKQDIERMMREAEQHAEEDRRRKEAAETRNQAEQLVYSTEKLLQENPDKIPSDVTSEVNEALADLKDKLKGEDSPAIRTSMERAATVAQKIGTALYAQAGGPQASAGTGPTQSGDEEEVVDAEIVDDQTPKGATG